jgi:hypothetical protein
MFDNDLIVLGMLYPEQHAEAELLTAEVPS